MNKQEKFWRLSSEVFDRHAEEYDRWFDEGELFGIECEALLQLDTPLAGPKVEVGVGPGRFAAELGVDIGIDPALAPLKIAARRGIIPCRGIGESLPLSDKSCGTVFLLFTLCFLEDPQKTLHECSRILCPGGHLVIGMITAESAWGHSLAEKKKKGHPYYKQARFYTPATVRQWLADCGLTVTEQRSTLRHPPETISPEEKSQPGIHPEAGFAIIVGTKNRG